MQWTRDVEVYCGHYRYWVSCLNNVEIIVQRNWVDLSLQDLLRLAKQLKYPGVTTLRLSVCPEDQLSGKLTLVRSFFLVSSCVMSSCVMSLVGLWRWKSSSWVTVSQHFGSADPRTTDTLFVFTRSCSLWHPVAFKFPFRVHQTRKVVFFECSCLCLFLQLSVYVSHFLSTLPTVHAV